ncbi:MAG: hypothetical protein AAFR38_03400 [Planctomycetota bacterium]
MNRGFEEGGWDRKKNPILFVFGWLGDRSYSLYLVHLLIFAVTKVVTEKAVGVD